MNKEQIGKRVAFEYGYGIRMDKEPHGPYPIFGSNGPTGFINSFKVEGPGVIIGRKGSVGKVAYSSKNFTPTDTTYYLNILDKSKDDLKFWYYFLQILGLEKLNTHSAVPGLSRELAYLLEVKIPSINIQKDAAAFLSLIDSKIDCNKRINAELDSIAQTLYDYWFVQFDFPDANGKPYKSSGGFLEYNDALKREIPIGWKSTVLGDIYDLYQPKTISEKEMSIDGKYLVYGANGIVGRYEHFNHADSVVAITCRGNTCGAINITRPYSWITGNAMVVKPLDQNISADFIVNTLKRSSLSKIITGSAQPQITRSNLSPLPIIYPPINLIKDYSLIVSDSFNKRISALEENEKLEKLRDWLLPMLMNGQVTVSQ